LGVDSALGDQEIMAVVVVDGDSSIQSLSIYVAEQLPAFMVPRFFELTDEIPKTESGKIRKYELRSRGVGPNTWDREKSE
jgi:crotonobetaine/carnitine-CoA ligase